MVSLSVHRLLYDGIRTMKSEELMRPGLGDMDRRVQLAAGPALPLRPREVLRRGAGDPRARAAPRHPAPAAWAPGGLAFARLRAAYALLASGRPAQTADARGRQRVSPSSRWRRARSCSPPCSKRPDPSAREAIRQEVDAGAGALGPPRPRDLAEGLALGARATSWSRALEEKMERYHALLDGGGGRRELKTDIEVILGRASAMLRLARQAPPAAELRPLRPAAARSRPRPPTPHRARAPPADAPEAEMPEPSLAVAEPPEPSRREPAPPHARCVRGTAPGLAGIGPSSHRPADRAPPDGGRGAHDRVRLRQRVEVYARLVDLAPDSRGLPLRLAIAMACYPAHREAGRARVPGGAAPRPDNADIHYQFGLYYKAMRQRARAVAEMQTAVRLNPRHAGPAGAGGPLAQGLGAHQPEEAASRLAGTHHGRVTSS